MDDVKNGRSLSLEFVKNAIRKSSNKCSPIILMHRRMKLWMTSNCFQGRFDRPEEFFSETKPLILIPPVGFRDILTGFGV